MEEALAFAHADLYADAPAAPRVLRSKLQA